MVGRTSFTSWFDVDEPVEVCGFRQMKEVVSYGDYLVLYSLFNLQPV